MLKRGYGMRLRSLKVNFLDMAVQERGLFVISYRDLREKDLTSLQDFDLSTVKKKERVSRADPKVKVTAEGLALLKQLGLV
jgi:hypothetical protein